MKHRYLLGDSQRESARLRAQAKLWDPVAHALFDRVGVKRGWRVLEIGPGQGSLHLELRRRVHGPIDAVEPSPIFAKRLRAITARDGFGRGTIHEVPLADAQLPDSHYDFIFARWVFLFLREPQSHVDQLARALKRGGVLALEDYHRDSWMLVPRPDEWTHFLEADREFFRRTGSDANIGTRLPQLFTNAGLDVIGVRPETKWGAPKSAVWRWLSGYALGVLDRYAEIPPFTQREAERLREHWLAAEKMRGALQIAPTVLDVVGKKR